MSTSQSHSPERLQDQYEQQELEDSSATPEPMQASVSSSSPITRTVAIIKPHALQHRFDIERRIQEASFEVCVAPYLMLACSIDCALFYSWLYIIDCKGKADGV